MRVLVTGGTGVTDLGSASRALAGCDAVVHAAAVSNLDARAHRTIARTNVAGAEPEFGVLPRPLEETYRDTVRWLYEGGHITAQQAGAVVERTEIRT